MKLIAQADVVIALGSRMGPFGTLPQHGMDYWPKEAKIIQVEADHTNLGLVKKITVGIHGDAKATAKELLSLAAHVRNQVHQAFAITLTNEPVLVNCTL